MSDSLKEDYDLAEQLKNKARQYYEKNTYDSALDFADTSLSIFKRLNVFDKMQECLLLKSQIYTAKSEFKKSLEILDECEKLCLKYDLNEGLMKTYNSKGNNLAYLTNYPHATVAFENSLKIAKAIYNQKSIITSGLNLLTIYTITKDYKKALTVIQDNYRILKGTDNKELFSKFLEKIALLFYDMKMYDKSIEIYNSLNKYLESTNNEVRLSNIMLYMGLINYSEENYKDALKFYENSFNLKEKLKIDFIKVVYYLNLGNTYLKLGELENAEKYFKMFLNEQNENKLYLGMLYESEAELNIKKDNIEEANQFFEKALDVFKNLERADKFSEVSINYAKFLKTNSNSEKAIAILEEAMKFCEQKTLFSNLIDTCKELSLIYTGLNETEKINLHENKIKYLNLLKEKKENKTEEDIATLISDIKNLNLTIQ